MGRDKTRGWTEALYWPGITLCYNAAAGGPADHALYTKQIHQVSAGDAPADRFAASQDRGQPRTRRRYDDGIARR
ncbi:hypothetical protein NITLEN_60037 [Nitrospira lenta]|uniref:Uncharacterized protein n=1 Tax=Nitrospira lenta TaxID=1436998 RepID=A0A330LAW1_9BACT|nr:hypothetical protein NITLEN_60037 [Nitrospira lenta]